MNEPFEYVALVGTSFVEADDNLNDLMRTLRGMFDPNVGEDVVVWRGLKRVVAILHAGGGETIFERVESRSFYVDVARAIVANATKKPD